MVVKLRLETGEIKSYDVWVGQGDDRTTYHTMCGKKYSSDNPEDRNNDCNHIGCAIYAADRKVISLPLALLFLLSFVWILLDYTDSTLELDPLWIGILFWIIYIIWYFYEKRDLTSTDPRKQRLRELREFKEHRTVNGIKAEQIFD